MRSCSTTWCSSRNGRFPTWGTRSTQRWPETSSTSRLRCTRSFTGRPSAARPNGRTGTTLWAVCSSRTCCPAGSSGPPSRASGTAAPRASTSGNPTLFDHSLPGTVTRSKPLPTTRRACASSRDFETSLAFVAETSQLPWSATVQPTRAPTNHSTLPSVSKFSAWTSRKTASSAQSSFDGPAHGTAQHGTARHGTRRCEL
mmetsp:Transcript_5230/g.16802  ORF Transcript_5230/g.16802 Transcript_5230/m.16802 type:complete len:200 (+) Transcript_5230:640-1239(+)